jgi:hypothetical protein
MRKKLLLVLLALTVAFCVIFGFTCGEESTASQGLEFTMLSDNKSYALTGLGTNMNSKLIIPSSYNNLPVTQIGLYASMEEVYAAYPNINNMTEAELTALRYKLSFLSGNRVSKIIIPNGITTIGIMAFARNVGITQLTLPDTITSIGYSAFIYCTSLTSISIPDSVTSLWYGAFGYCSSLTSVTIGNSIKSISENVFYSCSSLKSITIPDNVTSIGNWAFGYCSSLTSVTITDSVKSIGENAFYDCSSLKTVYFKGKAEGWKKISISNNSNTNLTSATRYYYSETEPTESGNYWHYDTDGVTPVVWKKETT